MKVLRQTEEIFRALSRVGLRLLFKSPDTFVVFSNDDGMAAVWNPRINHSKNFSIKNVKKVYKATKKKGEFIFGETGISIQEIHVPYQDLDEKEEKEIAALDKFYNPPVTSSFSLLRGQFEDLIKDIRAIGGPTKNRYIQFSKDSGAPFYANVYCIKDDVALMRSELGQEKVKPFLVSIRGDYFKRLVPDDYEVTIRRDKIEFISTNYNIVYLLSDEDQQRCKAPTNF